jgi:hypothetical protein
MRTAGLFTSSKPHSQHSPQHEVVKSLPPPSQSPHLFASPVTSHTASQHLSASQRDPERCLGCTYSLLWHRSRGQHFSRWWCNPTAALPCLYRAQGLSWPRWRRCCPMLTLSCRFFSKFHVEGKESYSVFSLAQSHSVRAKSTFIHFQWPFIRIQDACHIPSHGLHAI